MNIAYQPLVRSFVIMFVLHTYYFVVYGIQYSLTSKVATTVRTSPPSFNACGRGRTIVVSISIDDYSSFTSLRYSESCWKKKKKVNIKFIYNDFLLVFIIFLCFLLFFVFHEVICHVFNLYTKYHVNLHSIG